MPTDRGSRKGGACAEAILGELKGRNSWEVGRGWVTGDAEALVADFRVV